MLWRGLKIACHSLVHTVHFLKDADQWQTDSPVRCHFVCTVCMVEIGMDGSIVVLTISERVA